MNPQPKPPVRAPRTPRPIARRRAHPSRAQKKRDRPTRFCSAPRCYKQPVHFGMCGAHAKAHLDELQRRDVVRPGSECEARAWHASLFPCGGSLQTNHKIEREYLMTRWLRDNVLCGCAALNVWAFRHRREWARMLRDWEGAPAYDALEARALSGEKVEWDATHADLHARLGEAVEVNEEAA